MKDTARRKTFWVVGAVALVAAISVSAHQGGSDGHRVTPQELAGLIERGEAVVVDVRTRREFREGHIPEALNVPLDEVSDRADEINQRAGGRMVVLYCRSGRRAGIAEEILADRGIRELHHLEGQMSGWARAGLPVARGE